MPSRQRIESLERQIIEAALDQPQPTQLLKDLLNRYLSYIEHRNRQQGSHEALSSELD